jgi:hypothetical protein
MKHINWGRAVLAGLVVNVASFILGGGGYLLFGHMFSLEPTFLWRWTPETMSEMSPSWWVLLIAGNTALAIVVGLVYAVLYHGLPGRGIWKGLAYGLILWLIGVLPPAFTMYVMTVINGRVIAYLIAQGLVEYLAYGVLVALIYGSAPVEHPSQQARGSPDGRGSA